MATANAALDDRSGAARETAAALAGFERQGARLDTDAAAELLVELGAKT